MGAGGLPIVLDGGPGEKIKTTMRDRVDRLRGWLVGAALLLLMVVGGFLGFAHYRSRAFLAGLPGKLGMDITRETDGYTYSQTVEGRTVFTLHAAKMEQRRDGLVKLHDVGVVVYGRRQDRADRIYGKEFEYDQGAGIVRALGVVNLDLQAPAAAMASAAASTEARVIHVTTSGLVYLTKLGVAATGEEVEFSEGSMSGRAHGADFNSDTGVVVLQSAVRVNGLTASGPMVLTAGRAELDRSNQVAHLAGARLVTTAETVEAAQAVVHVRKDGTPERVEGTGRVVVSRAEGGVLTAERGEGTVSAAGKAEGARFGGGVRFVEDDAGQKGEGQAGEVVVRFDGAGLAEGVTMLGGVTMAERVAGSRRTLEGKVVEVGLGPGVGRRREMREAHAVGGGRVVVLNDAPAGGKGGASTTELAGDDMRAAFVGGRRIGNVVAVGHTVLHQVDVAGVEERSEGERTELVFRPAAGGSGIGEVQSAIQTGQVAMVRKSGTGQGAAAAVVEQRGTAERAAFDGETNKLTLSGGVVLGDLTSTLWGAKVVVDRASGDATAEGGVRVSYLQAGGSGRDGEPLHVLADHAVLRRGRAAADSEIREGVGSGRGMANDGVGRGGDRAFFYGGGGKAARLWQGGSQVEAPVLEFDQGARRLTANGPGGGAQVHAVLVGAGRPAAAPGGKAGAPPAGQTGASPAELPGGMRPEVGKAASAQPNAGGAVRVASREMVYGEASREVVFTGGVLVEEADGRMRADHATAYLAARPQGAGRAGAQASLPTSKAAREASAFFGGSVDRIVASGKVELEQPGRRGRGEQMVYTAGDGMFVLTGTAGAPPRVEDEARGTVTGASLRFHRGDDSVVVTGGGIEHGLDAAGRPVRTGTSRTETRVKQQ